MGKGAPCLGRSRAPGVTPFPLGTDTCPLLAPSQRSASNGFLPRPKLGGYQWEHSQGPAQIFENPSDPGGAGGGTKLSAPLQNAGSPLPSTSPSPTNTTRWLRAATLAGAGLSGWRETALSPGSVHSSPTLTEGRRAAPLLSRSRRQSISWLGRVVVRVAAAPDREVWGRGEDGAPQL